MHICITLHSYLFIYCCIVVVKQEFHTIDSFDYQRKNDVRLLGLISSCSCARLISIFSSLQAVELMTTSTSEIVMFTRKSFTIVKCCSTSILIESLLYPSHQRIGTRRIQTRHTSVNDRRFSSLFT
jgi:hypothetical protein